jgi:hypothetical protein
MQGPLNQSFLHSIKHNGYYVSIRLVGRIHDIIDKNRAEYQTNPPILTLVERKVEK